MSFSAKSRFMRGAFAGQGAAASGTLAVRCRTTTVTAVATITKATIATFVVMRIDVRREPVRTALYSLKAYLTRPARRQRKKRPSLRRAHWRRLASEPQIPHTILIDGQRRHLPRAVAPEDDEPELRPSKRVGVLRRQRDHGIGTTLQHERSAVDRGNQCRLRFIADVGARQLLQLRRRRRRLLRTLIDLHAAVLIGHADPVALLRPLRAAGVRQDDAGVDVAVEDAVFMRELAHGGIGRRADAAVEEHPRHVSPASDAAVRELPHE